jgi:hypothetical protein
MTYMLNRETKVEHRDALLRGASSLAAGRERGVYRMQILREFQPSTTMAKTALITGATGLLGRQVVKAFERAGWDVKGTGFTRAKPPGVLKVDLGSESDVAQALTDIK